MNLQDFALDFWMCLKLFVASCDIYIVIYSACDVCCDIYVICNACDMGSFIREKQKKRICLVTLPCARD